MNADLTYVCWPQEGNMPTALGWGWRDDRGGGTRKQFQRILTYYAYDIVAYIPNDFESDRMKCHDCFSRDQFTGLLSRGQLNS